MYEYLKVFKYFFSSIYTVFVILLSLNESICVYSNDQDYVLWSWKLQHCNFSPTNNPRTEEENSFAPGQWTKSLDCPGNH